MSTITNNNIPSRYPNRSSEDKSLIYGILDEGKFCTVAYVKEGKPYQIPTGYCRMDNQLLIHGSAKSHFLKEVLQSGEVSMSVMLFDGLVLAPTAFNHSVNYRSVVIFSNPVEIVNESQKVAFFNAFTNKYIPGRMDDLQPPSSKEIALTSVLSFNLEHATSKVRSGPVEVDTSNSEVWSGIVPATVAYGIPEPDPGMKAGIATPKYLTQMVVKSNT